MKDPKVWNVIGWVCFVLACLTTAIYFFVDDNYVESPTWLIASVASWFYGDHLLKANDQKASEAQSDA